MPPPAASRHLYTLNNAGQYALFEDKLKSATVDLQYGYTVEGLKALLPYVRDSTIRLVQECGAGGSRDNSGGGAAAQAAGKAPPGHFLPLEALVMLFEFIGGVLTMGLAVEYTVGNADLRVPRAYLSQACISLITDLPMWGVAKVPNEKYKTHDLMKYWLENVQFAHSASVVYSIVTLIDPIVCFLAAPGSVLGSTGMQQLMRFMRGTFEGGEAGVEADDHIADLPVPAQRLRAAYIALRLARLLTCMVLTAEVGAAVQQVMVKQRSKDYSELIRHLRTVRPSLQCSMHATSTDHRCKPTLLAACDTASTVHVRRFLDGVGC